MQRPLYMRPQDALEYNLIDEIIQPDMPKVLLYCTACTVLPYCTAVLLVFVLLHDCLQPLARHARDHM